MRVKEKSEKAGLKLNIQKTKIMTSSLTTSRQIEGENGEAMTDFIFLGSKTTAGSDCSHKIKRHLLLGRKTMTNLDSIKKQRHEFADKDPFGQSYGFPVVMYGCESWTIKKADYRRTDTFELQCWRRLLRVPCTVKRSNESILKEINPEYSLEGLIMKLQYFGHLM